MGSIPERVWNSWMGLPGFEPESTEPKSTNLNQALKSPKGARVLVPKLVKSGHKSISRCLLSQQSPFTLHALKLDVNVETDF
jgi:hypothetical protein